MNLIVFVNLQKFFVDILNIWNSFANIFIVWNFFANILFVYSINVNNSLLSNVFSILFAILERIIFNNIIIYEKFFIYNKLFIMTNVYLKIWREIDETIKYIKKKLNVNINYNRHEILIFKNIFFIFEKQKCRRQRV